MQKYDTHCYSKLYQLFKRTCGVQGLCRALGFPTKVQAAALIFLKRFYLAFSVLDHDPKNYMLTCIYLAGKARPWLDNQAFHKP